VDETVAAGFGHEWSTFRQDEDNFSASDREAMFHSYFHIFPWEALPADSVGADVGCGSGRWSVMVVPRVGHLHLLDASPEALAVARRNLSRASNTTFHLASVGELPPLARTAALVQRAGISTALIPLESYRNRSFYVMRTDAYDRFCTSLEKRFTRKQIEQMLQDAGFEQIRFSEQVPFWCAIGLKR
jgi:ubiquinone/menaquinone biosynthesis C-methylase UbiE